jgi:hypothetical protein
MLRSPAGWLACTLVAAGAWLGPVRSLQAAPPSFAGNWKIIVFDEDGLEITLGLVQLTVKDDQVGAALLASTNSLFKKAAVERVRADDKSIAITIKAGQSTFVMTVYLPGDDKKPKKLLGNLETGSQRDFAWLERTTLKKLDSDPKKSEKESPAKKAFVKASEEEDEEKKEEGFKAIERDYAPDPMAYYSGLNLVALLVNKETKDKAVQRQVDKTLKMASLYGPKMKMRAYVQVLRQLAASEKMAPLTIRYARQAEKMATNADPPGLRMAIIRTLADTLILTGKKEEAKALEPRIARLDAILDQVFVKNNIPFKPKVYAGRKGKSDRVAVVELFTGAQCPPCVAADVAFDALLKTYKPSEVVLLQYHLHVPGPDPLTNADTEQRAKFYGLSGTPTAFVNGAKVEGLGGSRPEGEEAYQELRKMLNKQLEEPAQAKLKVTAKRNGNTIDITGEFAGLKKTGKDVRLRFVLVEDLVRYPGGNGQRFHHHVVRAMPGGVKGFALEKKSGKQTATVDLTELRKSLNDYLTAWPKKRDLDEDPFPPPSRPLDLKHLKVIALIQDEGAEDKDILQAAQVDVPEGK